MIDLDPTQRGLNAIERAKVRQEARKVLSDVFPGLLWESPSLEEMKRLAQTDPQGLLRTLGNMNTALGSTFQATKADRS